MALAREFTNDYFILNHSRAKRTLTTLHHVKQKSVLLDRITNHTTAETYDATAEIVHQTFCVLSLSTSCIARPQVTGVKLLTGFRVLVLVLVLVLRR